MAFGDNMSEKIDWQKLDREWDEMMSARIKKMPWLEPITNQTRLDFEEAREEFWAERGGRTRYFKHIDELEAGQPLESLRRRYLKEVSNDGTV